MLKDETHSLLQAWIPDTRDNYPRGKICIHNLLSTSGEQAPHGSIHPNHSISVLLRRTSGIIHSLLPSLTEPPQSFLLVQPLSDAVGLAQFVPGCVPLFTHSASIRYPPSLVLSSTLPSGSLAPRARFPKLHDAWASLPTPLALLNHNPTRNCSHSDARFPFCSHSVPWPSQQTALDPGRWSFAPLLSKSISPISDPP